MDWNNWGDDASKTNHEENPEEEQEISAVELFKDMEPTIAKAKVVCFPRISA